MRRTLSILFCLTALLLTGSCSRRQLDDYPDSQLTVRVFIPAERVTRSEIGETGSQQEEKAIKRLQIWVFRHSDGSLIGYLDPPVGNLQSGTVQTYSMFLSDAVANDKPHVDVYAIANSGSTGLTLDANTGRSVLDAAAMSGSAFGVGSPVTSVPQEGLPFAGVSKNLEMTGSYPVLEVETVTITRAVSKVQILLCRQPGEITDAFILEGIHLSGQIGASERLFTNATYSGHTFGTKLFDIIGGSYETLSYDFPVPETIPACDNPGEFIFRSTGHEAETPHEYGRRLDAAIATGTLLSPGRLYLRETDKQLSGSISYRTVAGGPLKVLNFTMNAAGDFTRNHTWIIYAYFLGGKLYVQPTILPWIAGHARFSHSTQGRSTLEYSNYLRYDKDRMTNTWGDSYVSVAYGYASGIPQYSPLLAIRTESTNNFRLQVDNESFRFVIKSGEAYTQVGQSVIIEGQSGEQVTQFYLVPVSSSTPTDPVAKVVLTELFPAGFPPSNFPFNQVLPGWEIDNTVIRFFNIGAATYSENQYNVKQPGTQQDTMYWIEETTP